MEKIQVKDLLDAGVHFGHLRKKVESKNVFIHFSRT